MMIVAYSLQYTHPAKSFIAIQERRARYLVDNCSLQGVLQAEVVDCLQECMQLPCPLYAAA